MTEATPTLTAAALAAAHDLTLDCNGDLPISGLCGLTDDLPGHLSFLGSDKLVDAALASRIEVFVTPEAIALPGKTRLIAADPDMAMAAIAERFARDPLAQAEAIAPGAHVDPSAQLGEGVRIGPNAVVGADVVLGPGTRVHAGAFVGDRVVTGRDCIIHANAVLREDSLLGDRVILQPGAAVGGDGYGYVTRDGHHHKIPQVGRVILADDVEIGANATVDRGRFSATYVGRGTKIDNLVMVGHNCQLGEDCLVVSQVGISGSTRLGDRVVLAGQVGVAGHIEIASDVTALGMTMVAGSIKEPGVYAGHPAKPVKLWRRAVARYWQAAKK